MTRRLVAVALLLVAAVLCWWQVTPHAVLSAAPIDHGAIVEVRVIYEDGFVEVVYAGDGVVPPTIQPQATATHTPTPSRTPTITPTAPWPTFTATDTPGWTPTVEDFRTPTVTPLPTPTPTITPTPELPGCLLVVTSGVPLNIRDAPYGAVIGQAQPGQMLKPEGTAYDDNGVLWYQIYGVPGQAGYVISTWVEPKGGTDCTQVRAGPHILMGEGASAVEPYAAGISAAKCLPGSYQICLKLKQANPAIWIIARPLTDHLATDYRFNPLLAWDAVRGAVPSGFDAVELENESTPSDDKLAMWVQFSIGLAELVAHDTGMQYLAFSFGPGNPPESVWPLLLPYLEWVSTHPLPGGRYHGIAIHAAPYATFDRPDMPWVNNLYLAGRIYWERALLAEETGFDLATWPGVLAVTELGLSDGYSGDWNAPYSCAEAADAYRTTQAVYRAAGYPQVLIWWNFGGTFWTSDADCVRMMFG